jgi:hypothetical protein
MIDEITYKTQMELILLLHFTEESLCHTDSEAKQKRKVLSNRGKRGRLICWPLGAGNFFFRSLLVSETNKFPFSSPFPFTLVFYFAKLSW